MLNFEETFLFNCSYKTYNITE